MGRIHRWGMILAFLVIIGCAYIGIKMVFIEDKDSEVPSVTGMQLVDAVDALQAAVDGCKALADETAKANAYHDAVLPAMDALRAAADAAETICGEEYWPLPSYSKMLYYV